MPNQKISLIVNTGSATKGPDDIFKELKRIGVDVEIKEFISAENQKKKTARQSNFIVETDLNTSEINEWDAAHVANKSIPDSRSFVEPDKENEFVVNSKVSSFKSHKKEITGEDDSLDFDKDWMPHENKIWHLSDDHSQLLKARTAVENLSGNITIAHVDTGYDKDHFIIPKNLNLKYQKNFVENNNSAVDNFSDGFLKQPGHGTGTIGILAGNKINIKNGAFNTDLGAASFAEIIPLRISGSVVLLRTSAFAQAINYLTNLTMSGEKIIHVVTMSMGGSASKNWADAVNAAYEAGITNVSAAGNHFGGLPTGRLIYPARFNRVIAACGVTFDFKPYLHKKKTEMQGCCGPERVMKTAIAAFTPNTPWAKAGKNSISFGGAGTSSATPQIAAAAAIYYKKYKKELDQLKGWQKVEAIRHALFSTAKQKGKTTSEYFGNGIIQAFDALQVPVTTSKLKKSEEDKVGFFPELTVIFKANKPVNKNEYDMFNVEAAQLVQEDKKLQMLMHDEEKTFSELNKKEKKHVIDRLIENPKTSLALKSYLKDNYEKMGK